MNYRSLYNDRSIDEKNPIMQGSAYVKGQQYGRNEGAVASGHDGYMLLDFSQAVYFEQNVFSTNFARTK